jgi:hypothetical protein
MSWELYILLERNAVQTYFKPFPALRTPSQAPAVNFS